MKRKSKKMTEHSDYNNDLKATLDSAKEGRKINKGKK